MAAPSRRHSDRSMTAQTLVVLLAVAGLILAEIAPPLSADGSTLPWAPTAGIVLALALAMGWGWALLAPATVLLCLALGLVDTGALILAAAQAAMLGAAALLLKRQGWREPRHLVSRVRGTLTLLGVSVAATLPVALVSVALAWPADGWMVARLLVSGWIGQLAGIVTVAPACLWALATVRDRIAGAALARAPFAAPPFWPVSARHRRLLALSQAGVVLATLIVAFLAPALLSDSVPPVFAGVLLLIPLLWIAASQGPQGTAAALLAAAIGTAALVPLFGLQDRFADYKLLLLVLGAAMLVLSAGVSRLADQRAQFARFIAASPAALAMVDRDGRITGVTAPFLRDLGLDDLAVDDGRSLRLADLTGPLEPLPWGAAVERALAGEAGSREDTLTLPDGSRQVIEWQVRPWQDDMGEIGAAIIEYQRLTPLREAERQAQQRAALLSVAFDTSPDGILIAGLDAPPVWNRRFATLWGLNVADMAACDSRELLQLCARRASDPVDFLRHVRRLLRDPEPVETDAEIRLRDGRVLLSNSGRLADAGDQDRRIWFFRDITAPRLAEQALQRSEQRFREIVDATGGYVWETGADGRITFISDRATAILGYRPLELLGRLGTELLVPDEHDSAVRLFRDAIDSGHTVRGREFRARGRDGTLVWLRISATPMRDAHGRFAGFRGASHDVTAEVAARDALARSERRTRAVFDTAADGILTFREDGRIQAINPAARTIFGLPHWPETDNDTAALPTIGELVPGLTDLAPRSDADGSGPAAGAAGAVQDPVPTILTARRRDGDSFPLEASLGRWHDGDGWMMVAVVRDVSSRMAVSQALRESEQRAADIAGFITDGLWETDAEGRLTLLSDQFGRALGGAGEELLGRPLAALLAFDPPADVSQAAAVATALDEHRPFRRMIAPLNLPAAATGPVATGPAATGPAATGLADEADPDADRRLVWVRLSGKPLTDADGRFRGFRGAAIDITEELRRTEIEQQRQRLELLGEMAGNVAHEINNLLQPILSFAGFARRRIGDGDADIAGYLDTVLDCTHSARDVVRKVLSFAHQGLPDREALEVAVDLRRAVGVAKAALPAAIQVVEDIPDLPGSIHAAPGELTQIVVNLMVNARDAMPDGGTITVSLRVRDSADVPADTLGLAPGPAFLIRVADTGRGMDRGTRERALLPFFTTKPAGTGTGMGLPLVYGLLQSWGGGLTIDSTPGQGTAINLYIPRHDSTIADMTDLTDCEAGKADGVHSGD